MNPLFHAPAELFVHGMRVIVSPLLPQTIWRDYRPLQTKQWHGNRGTGNYAKRIEKKWRKRYGQWKEEVHAYAMNDIAFDLRGRPRDTGGKILVVSAAKFAQIKEAIRGS